MLLKNNIQYHVIVNTKQNILYSNAQQLLILQKYQYIILLLFI